MAARKAQNADISEALKQGQKKPSLPSKMPKKSSSRKDEHISIDVSKRSSEIDAAIKI